MATCRCGPRPGMSESTPSKEREEEKAREQPERRRKANLTWIQGPSCKILIFLEICRAPSMFTLKTDVSQIFFFINLSLYFSTLSVALTWLHRTDAVVYIAIVSHSTCLCRIHSLYSWAVL